MNAYVFYLLGAAVVSPFTNDSSALPWLIPVCAISLILVIVLIIVGKKRK